MLETSPEQVLQILHKLDIRPGDGLLVHSALQFLGRPQGGPTMYLNCLQTVLGPQGSLAAPAFNFGFAKGLPFDPAQTPSQGMGVLSETIRTAPGAYRTPHPLQSLALLGKYAPMLAACDTVGAFDNDSAFAKLLELDFKLLLLGADIQAASMVHYSEQRAAVPYRYWKDFTGLVRTSNGWQQRTYRMFARDLTLNPQLALQPIQNLLEQRQQWQSAPLGYGQVCLCRLQDFVTATTDLLRQDPWILISNRPSEDAHVNHV
jgi:aminoglycoside N3'-acetyltransferase